MTDVDFDTHPSFDPKKYFKNAVKASRVRDGELIPHPCGVYFQDIPKDPITGLSAIPYKDAEDVGYMKVDFLHLSILSYFESKREIRALINIEPDWSLLEEEDIVQKLFHIGKHYDLIIKVRPKSIIELSDCLALMRPGKKHLLGKYLKDRVQTRKILYQKTEGGYVFRHSHSIAYALNIVLQLHLIKAGLL